jgi:hypothetical protein
MDPNRTPPIQRLKMTNTINPIKKNQVISFFDKPSKKWVRVHGDIIKNKDGQCLFVPYWWDFIILKKVPKLKKDS